MKSLFTARNLLKDLSAEQNQVFSSNKIEGDYTADQWLIFLRELLHFDKMARRAKTWAILITLLGIVLTVAGIGLQNWWIAGTGGVITLFLGLPPLFKFGGKKLHPHASRFALPVVEIFRHDVDEKTPLFLKLDLGKTFADSNQTNRREITDREFPVNVRSCTEYLYTNPWFSLSTKLVDGSKLAFTAVNHGLLRRTVKRSVSGKTKVKQKYKTKQQLTLRLRPPNETYQWSSDIVLSEHPQALSNGMLAWVKKQADSVDTLLLRREQRDTSLYRPGSELLDPARLVEIVDTALIIVRPADESGSPGATVS